MLEKPRRHHGIVDPRGRGAGGSSADPRLRLSGRDGPRHRPSSSSSLPASSSSSSPPRLPQPSSSSSVLAASENGGDFDPVLLRNVREMLPLVESLIERTTNPSFTRRASMIYTPTPSSARKISEAKGKKMVQSASSKKQGNNNGSRSSKLMDGDDDDNGVDGFSIFSSTVPEVENIQREREELVLLKEQVDDLQNKLLEKDEILKTLENSMDQMSSVYTTVDELKHQIVEKDLMVKSFQSQLANAKVKLADKQAALEKLEWEAKTSNQKVEKLQGDMQIIESGVTAFMQLYEELSNGGFNTLMDKDITYFDNFDHLSNIDVNEDGMEEARRAYLAAVAAAKEIPTDETLSVAAEARARLQAFVLTC